MRTKNALTRKEAGLNRPVRLILALAAALLILLGAASAASAEGWQQSGERWWYAFDDGQYARNQWLQSGAWYHFDDEGWMQTGWQWIDGHWYYLGPDGAMQSGWQQIDGEWYNLGPDGVMVTGWSLSGGRWYYLQADGTMATGWLPQGGSWYYLQPDGALVTGWLELDGDWYYLREDGSMATGWLELGEDWYYLQPGGTMTTGWMTDSDGTTTYYFLDSGRMAQDESVVIDGTEYYFSADGRLLTSPSPNLPVNRENILALLDMYDKDGAYIVRNSAEGTLLGWLEGADTLADTVKSSGLDTAVHEQCHDFCGTPSGAAYNEILGMGYRTYEWIYIGNEEYIVVPQTVTFASSEFVSSVPESLRTFRFDTYVDADIFMGSVQYGPYGLLDEWTAYCWGFNNKISMYPYIQENNIYTYSDNTYLAYAEFKYYILEYMLYAQENYPEVYDGILSNEAFKQAYVTIDTIFGGLVEQYWGTQFVSNFYMSEYKVLDDELKTDKFVKMDALLR